MISVSLEFSIATVTMSTFIDASPCYITIIWPLAYHLTFKQPFYLHLSFVLSVIIWPWPIIWLLTNIWLSLIIWPFSHHLTLTYYLTFTIHLTSHQWFNVDLIFHLSPLNRLAVQRSLLACCPTLLKIFKTSWCFLNNLILTISRLVIPFRV